MGAGCMMQLERRGGRSRRVALAVVCRLCQSHRGCSEQAVAGSLARLVGRAAIGGPCFAGYPPAQGDGWGMAEGWLHSAGGPSVS